MAKEQFVFGRKSYTSECSLSTIPLYILFVYREPVWVRTKIDQIRKKFLWRGPKKEGRGYNIIGWEKVCMCKKKGTLGIKQLD